MEFSQVIHDDGAGMVHCGFQIRAGFVDSMHEDVFTGNAACHCHANFTFAGAIHIQTVKLSPLGDGAI